MAMDKLIRKRARAQDDSPSSSSVFYPSSSMLDGALHIQGNSHAAPCVSHLWKHPQGYVTSLLVVSHPMKLMIKIKHHILHRNTY